MDDALAVQSLACTGLPQHVDRALLEDAGALALLDVGAVPALQNDAVDAGVVQEPGEQQPRGAAADDGDGGVVHGGQFSSSRMRFAMAKAAFAAGTPQ